MFTHSHTHRDASHAPDGHVHAHVAQHLASVLFLHGLELGLA